MYKRQALNCGQIAADVVLLAEICRSNMPLNQHILAARAQGLSDVFADLQAGHEHIKNIHAVIQRRRDCLADLRKGLAIQMLASKADNAGLAASFSNFRCV